MIPGPNYHYKLRKQATFGLGFTQEYLMTPWKWVSEWVNDLWKQINEEWELGVIVKL